MPRTQPHAATAGSGGSAVGDLDPPGVPDGAELGLLVRPPRRACALHTTPHSGGYWTSSSVAIPAR